MELFEIAGHSLSRAGTEGVSSATRVSLSAWLQNLLDFRIGYMWNQLVRLYGDVLNKTSYSLLVFFGSVLAYKIEKFDICAVSQLSLPVFFVFFV